MYRGDPCRASPAAGWIWVYLCSGDPAIWAVNFGLRAVIFRLNFLVILDTLVERGGM